MRALVLHFFHSFLVSFSEQYVLNYSFYAYYSVRLSMVHPTTLYINYCTRFNPPQSFVYQTTESSLLVPNIIWVHTLLWLTRDGLNTIFRFIVLSVISRTFSAHLSVIVRGKLKGS